MDCNLLRKQISSLTHKKAGLIRLVFIIIPIQGEYFGITPAPFQHGHNFINKPLHPSTESFVIA